MKEVRKNLNIRLPSLGAFLIFSITLSGCSETVQSSLESSSQRNSETLVSTKGQSGLEETSSRSNNKEVASETNSEKGLEAEKEINTPKEPSSTNKSTKKPKVSTESNLNPKSNLEPLVCQALYNSITPILCARQIGQKVELAGTAHPKTILTFFLKFIDSSDWVELDTELLADEAGYFFIPSFDLENVDFLIRVKQDFNDAFSAQVLISFNKK